MSDEVTGILASGKRFRVTPYMVEVREIDGEVIWQADVNDLLGVGREHLTVFLRDRSGGTFSMATSSLDDAGQIELLLGRRLQPLTVVGDIPAAAPSSSIPRAWILMGAITAVIGLLIAIGALAGGDTGGSNDNGVTVFYTVSDSSGGRVSLTYRNAGGNTEQMQDAETTWERRLTMEPGDFVYVSAQRGPGSGTVRCTITADGKRIERAESSGEFVIATCSGSVP